MPECCVSCATAASVSAISYSTRLETGCPDSNFRGECRQGTSVLAANRRFINRALIDKLAW
jgi:hypothetical protein